MLHNIHNVNDWAIWTKSEVTVFLTKYLYGYCDIIVGMTIDAFTKCVLKTLVVLVSVMGSFC